MKRKTVQSSMQYGVVASIFSGSVWQIIGQSSAFGVFILMALTLMSVVSWVIIFHKWRQFQTVERDNEAFLQIFRRSRQLAESFGQAKSRSSAPLSHIYMAGYNEIRLLSGSNDSASGTTGSQAALDDRDFDIIEMTMEKALTEQMGRLERKVIFLATTANAAPFM
ncbi:MAG TPA: hypothetical protein VN285_12510, partial [Candidatus Deferrimicrobium sp.]|nr:hypothetical protein [Candidatus Deferrimicrobium sp.]